MRRHLRAFGAVFAILLFSGCSAETSLNQLFTQDGSQDRHDARLAEGRALYDAGDFGKAKDLLTKLSEDYPDSQKAAILRAYAEFGNVGLSFFDLLKLAVLTKEEAQNDSSAVIKECGQYDEFISDGTQRGKLDCLLGINPGTDIFEGRTLEEVRQEDNILSAVDRVIRNMCGFFDAPENGENTQRVSGYSRHNCEKKPNIDVNGKGSLIWAFAHLFEATILNVQLEYIQSQISNLDVNSGINAVTFAATAASLGSNGAQVSRESLNDLKAVASSLSMVLRADTDLSVLNSATEKLEEGIDLAFGNEEEGSTGEVLTQLDDAIAENQTELQELDGEDAQNLCEGYENLGGDLGELETEIGGGFSCSGA